MEYYILYAQGGKGQPMSDLIDRHAVLGGKMVVVISGQAINAVPVSYIKTLPSAQSEIIQCKDCKYNDYNRRRLSVKWLPCMDVRTGSNWFCGSAERLEE